MNLVVAAGRGEWGEPSMALKCGNHVYAFNIPSQAGRAWADQKIKRKNGTTCFCTGALQGELVGEFAIGTTMKSVIELHAIGPVSVGQSIISNSEFYRAELLTWEMSDAYCDDGIEVTSIHLAKTYAFCVRLKADKLEKFDWNKAMEMGLTPDQARAVARGGTMAMEDGTEIARADLVMRYQDRHVMFIDCTCLEDLEKLPTDFSPFSVLIHFTETGFLMKDEYLSRFPDSVLNVCFVETGKNSIRSAKELYMKFHEIDHELFPRLSCELSDSTNLRHFVPVSAGDFIHWPQEKAVINSADREVIECHPVIPECKTLRFTILGTGAGFIEREKTTASILVQVPDGFILLDAGGGCLHQLRVKYGTRNTDSILEHLHCIWISHYHVDHHQGLVALLLRRRQITDGEIFLGCDSILLAELLRIEREVYGEGFFRIRHVNRSRIDLGTAVISSIPVDHVPESMACTVTLRNGIKLLYTGDMRYDPTFASQVGECNILICEGTFDDCMVEMAQQRKHCTFQQAIEMGKDTHAECTIITHLSARLDIKRLRAKEPNVIFAFDHLSAAYEDMKRVCSAVRAVRW